MRTRPKYKVTLGLTMNMETTRNLVLTEVKKLKLRGKWRSRSRTFAKKKKKTNKIYCKSIVDFQNCFVVTDVQLLNGSPNPDNLQHRERLSWSRLPGSSPETDTSIV